MKNWLGEFLFKEGKNFVYLVSAFVVVYILTILIMIFVFGVGEEFKGSPMFYLIPLGGIAFTFFSIEVFNDLTKSRFFSSIYAFFIYFVLMIASYYFMLKRFYLTSYLLSGYEKKRFVEFFAKQILHYSSPSPIALISAVVKAMSASSFMPFFVSVVLSFFAYWVLAYILMRKNILLSVSKD